MFQKAERRGSRPAAHLVDSIAGTDTIEFADQAGMLTLSAGHRVERPDPDRGFRLTDGPVALESGDDLFGHAAFTVSIDFCKEEADDRGALVSFDGSFSLALKGERLEATVTTTTGSRTLQAAVPELKPGRWHRATLLFDGAKGSAELYLDARKIASADDLKGAEQAGNFFAELLIGGPRDTSFNGLLDNFRMLDAAVAGSEPPAR